MITPFCTFRFLGEQIIFSPVVNIMFIIIRKRGRGGEDNDSMDELEDGARDRIAKEEKE